MASFRELIPELAQTSNPLFVLRELEQELMHEDDIGNFIAVDNLLHDVDLTRLPLKPVRVFFLRSATIEQLVPILRVKCLLAGLRAEIGIGSFGQYRQEVLDPGSPLYRFAPDIIVLAIRLVDMEPSLIYDFTALSEQDIQQRVDQVLITIGDMLKQIRARTNAHILVHNFEVPALPAYGIFDYQHSNGQVETIHGLNRDLREICQSVPGAYIFDYEGLSGRYGKLNWVEPRMWHMARVAPNPRHLHHLADEYLRYLLNLSGLTRKCLILDMDGTLWGGVVGEDGLGGIKLGITYPGSAFVEFQRAILDLYRRGIILALCSKNNEEDALEVLDKHPDMVLRREHFASMRINWRDKATNILEIAQELNIGVGSIVYLDDNPVEVAQVRQTIPEVLAYQLPPEPENYTIFLRSLPVFDSVSLTADDRRRGEEYRQQVARRSLEMSCASLEEFYQQLGMRATIKKADDTTIPRIAQLTQRTNQFNLTTRRYTEQEIRSHIASGSWHVYGLELEDRFGRNGLVAVGILRVDCSEIWIDSLLMSCRVMGRTVEQTLVYHLAIEARKLGFERLMAEYIPTPKNKVVANLYESLGFMPVERAGQDDGRSVWCLDLTNLKLTPSPFVSLVDGDGS